MLNGMMIERPDPMERSIRDQAQVITERIVRNTVDLIYDRFGGVRDEVGDIAPKALVIAECMLHAEGRDRVLRTEEDQKQTDLRHVYDVFQILFKHLSDRLKVYDDLAMERFNYEIKPTLMPKPEDKP